MAAVTITTLTGDNGILKEANRSKEEINEKTALEEVQMEAAGSFDDNGVYQVEIAKQNLKNNLGIAENDIKQNGSRLKVKYKAYTFNIDIDGKVNLSNGVDVVTIFDSTGKEEGKLHIGDFINYTAGTWSDDDMNKIAKTGIEPNRSADTPLTNYQFGGFEIGGSRDNNATPYDTTYNYVQEIKSDGTKQPVTGWRLFDVEENGTITLISAGCPEDYYHPYTTNGGFICEYILTGNVNSRVDPTSAKLGTTYKARDWSMYLNSEYKDIGSVTALTKEKLDSWYTKYTNTVDANSGVADTFRKIYKSEKNCINDGMYESLIDNYSYYWLASAGYGTYGAYCMKPDIRGFANRYDLKVAYGVRVLISIPSYVQISEKSVGTKTITSRDNDYNYNVWNLE